MHTHSQPNLNLIYCTQNLLPQKHFGFIQIKRERAKICADGNGHTIEGRETEADKLREKKEKEGKRATEMKMSRKNTRRILAVAISSHRRTK